MAQVGFAGPLVFLGQAALGRLIAARSFGYAVGTGEAGNAALHANGFVAHFLVAGHIFKSVIDVFAVGVGVDHKAFAALAAEKVVDRGIERFAFDVPERNVDGADGGHGDGTTTPIRAAIEVLPDVFGLERVAADQARDDVIGEITRDSEFAAVEGRVAETVDAFVGLDLQRNEVSSRRSDVDVGLGDFHGVRGYYGSLRWRGIRRRRRGFLQ